MQKKKRSFIKKMATQNTYSKDFKYQLYESVEDRNSIFGYDQLNLMRVQEAHNNAHFHDAPPGASCDVSSAPLDYYYDLRVRDKAVIGFTHATPNLYDDCVYPGQPTIEAPNLHKNWQTFTTTATPPLLKGCPVTFTEHEPVEIAPRLQSNYWLADLNARLYERQLINSAQENPYANFYGRQAMLNLLAQNMPNDNDPYLHRIEKPTDSFAYQLTNFGPPATY